VPVSLSVKQLVGRVAGGGLVLGLAGFAVYHQASLNSSERALREIETSFRDHDGTRLAYYLNTDAVTQQVSEAGVDWLQSQHYQEALAAAIAEVPGAEREATDSAARLLALKSALAERGAQGIATALSTGTSDSADVVVRLMAAFAGLPPLDVILAGDRLELVGLGDPKGSGTDRVVPLQLRDRDLNISIVVGVAVHKQGPRWQVSGIDGLDRTLAAIDNAQQERLIVANRPIESQLQDMVGIGSPEVARTAHGRYATNVRLRMRIDNRSTETMNAIDLGLTTQASDYDHAEMLHVDGPIPAGGAVMAEWSFDETRRGSSRTAAMLSHPGDLMVRARRVVTDSAGVADTVRLYKTYRALRRRRNR
jgi:hypothetical protein